MTHVTRPTWVLAALFMVLLAACGSTASANARDVPIPFTTFLQNVRNAKYTDYRTLPTTKVKNQKAFEEMRSYVLTRYQGQVTSSYIASGMTFDCVVQNVQSTHPLEPVRAPGSTLSNSGGDTPNTVPTTLPCQSGSAPLQRVTLEDLVQFSTLQDYLHIIKKSPGDIPPTGH